MNLVQTRTIISSLLSLSLLFMLGACSEDDPTGSGSGLPDSVSALHFDGITTFVRVSVNPHLQTTSNGSFTIEAWVRADSFEAWNWIYSHAPTNSNLDVLFGFDAGRARILSNNLSNDLTSTGAVTPNAWHHVAAVVDTVGGSVTTYLNGVENATADLVPGAEEVAGDIFIGARESFGTNKPAEHFIGKIHGLRVWKGALSKEQVQQTMKEPSPDLSGDDPFWGTATGLEVVAHWPMDDGSGTTIADKSGNGRNGQITDGVWEKVANPYKIFE